MTDNNLHADPHADPHADYAIDSNLSTRQTQTRLQRPRGLGGNWSVDRYILWFCIFQQRDNHKIEWRYTKCPT